MTLKVLFLSAAISCVHSAQNQSLRWGKMHLNIFYLFKSLFWIKIVVLNFDFIFYAISSTILSIYSHLLAFFKIGMLTFLACFFIIFISPFAKARPQMLCLCSHVCKGSFQYITQFVHSSKNVDITLYQNQMPNCTSLAILHSMFFWGINVLTCILKCICSYCILTLFSLTALI